MCVCVFCFWLFFQGDAMWFKNVGDNDNMIIVMILMMATMMIIIVTMIMVIFVGCLTSQQQQSVSQERICSDKFAYCHTEVEAAPYPVTVYWHQAGQSQRWPYNVRGLAVKPLEYQFLSLNFLWLDPEKSRCKRDSNHGVSALKADTLTTRLTGRW